MKLLNKMIHKLCFFVKNKYSKIGQKKAALNLKVNAALDIYLDSKY
jgi:hypothetical protein